MKATADNKPKREGQHTIPIRMPMSLYERLKAKADEEQRSVNAQVRYLVEQDLEAAA